MTDSRLWLALAFILFVIEMWMMGSGKPFELVALVSVKFSVCLAAAVILEKLEGMKGG